MKMCDLGEIRMWDSILTASRREVWDRVGAGCKKVVERNYFVVVTVPIDEVVLLSAWCASLAADQDKGLSRPHVGKSLEH